MASTPRSRLFFKLKKEVGLLCFSGMALLVSSCVQSQPVHSASSNMPYLALKRTNLSAIPEADLTGSLFIENGCVVFKAYGQTAGSTAIFDNRSKLILRPGGFVIERPRDKLLSGKAYSFSGGYTDGQVPLVTPIPANCPRSQVLLGTAEPVRSQ